MEQLIVGPDAGAGSDDELAAWIGELCRERLGGDVVGAPFAGAFAIARER